MNEIRLLGIGVHPLTMEQALAQVARYIKERKPRQAVFLNAGKYAEMEGSPALRAAVESADLRLADGQPLVWASRLLGKPLPERIAGVDLMHRLLAEGKTRGWRFYFLGATREVLEKAVDACVARYGVAVAGMQHGYYRPDEEETIARAIAVSGADIIFVAISSPRKELFIARWMPTMNVPFTMGVGGSLDIVAGVTRRAPRWMQRAGLEWFYRFAQEPGRLWRRYLHGNLYFLRRVAACFFRLCDCCREGR